MPLGGVAALSVFKETGSGAKLHRAERKKVMALAQERAIDAVLVTEPSRWGRGTLDLLHTLEELEARRVSVIAISGLAFDLATLHGRMMATVLAELERELIRERTRSGMAAAKARGRRLGRRLAQWPKADRLAPKVLALIAQGRSYRLIGRELGLSKNTVADIVRRKRAHHPAQWRVELPAPYREACFRVRSSGATAAPVPPRADLAATTPSPGALAQMSLRSH